MPAKLKIDVVSDVVCPWCAIGVASLDRALTTLAGEIEAELAFHPFELNPDLPPGGENGWSTSRANTASLRIRSAPTAPSSPSGRRRSGSR